MKALILSAYSETIDYINGISHSDLRRSGYYKLNNLINDLRKKNIDIVAKKNISKIENIADILISFDHPNLDKTESINFKKLAKLKILIQIEPECVRPINWNIQTYELYDYVLTWNDELVDDLKFIKFSPVSIDWNIKKHNSETSLIFSMVAANKTSAHQFELYSERKKIVNYFEKSTNDRIFELYGPGWDEICFYMDKFPFYYGNSKKLSKIRKIMKISKYKNWRGIITDKNEVLCNSRFNFAFENMYGSDGYILEKIFEPMVCGCIPIYYGAKNIDAYVNNDCFIDYRRFTSIKELVNFCLNLDVNEIKKYQSNISNFLKSKNIEKFKDEYFSKTILNLLK